MDNFDHGSERADDMPIHARLGDFFAGIGLVELALNPLGWVTVFANDINPKKYDIYARNFDASHYVVEDVWVLSPNDLPDLDLAWASFPCIDISVAGHKRGMRGTHSGTFWGFHHLLESLGERKPPLIVIENVKALFAGYDGQALHEVVNSLNYLGYRCDMFLINAAHFTPQSRPRIFIVGATNAPFEPVTSCAGVHSVRPKQIVEFMLSHNDLCWGFLDSPMLPDQTKTTFSDLAEDIPDDSSRWWGEKETEHILSQMTAAHIERVEELSRGHQIRYLTAYRRIRKGKTRAEVRFDGIAGCLRTPVGGSSRQIVVRVGDGRCRFRWMTSREYARLQGVPDSFRIEVPERQALFGFGDAVNIEVVRWLGRAILNPLWQSISPPISSGNE